jgi:fimbrial chaperone protein
MHVLLATATAAASLSCSSAVLAQTITPVVVELTPRARAASVSVTNTSDRAVRYQTEVLGWAQRDGRDHHAPSRDLLVVPPIADIAPGATQVFRVAPRQRPAGGERAYRLVLEDITPIDRTDPTIAAPPEEGSGLSVALRFRHSLPVFVQSVAGAGRARLVSCGEGASSGCVRIHNDGERHVSVRSIGLQGAGWQVDNRLGATRVLAGAWMEWTLDVPPDATGPLAARAETSVGPLGAMPLANRVGELRAAR